MNLRRHFLPLITLVVIASFFTPFAEEVNAQRVPRPDRTVNNYSGTWELGAWATSSVATLQEGTTLTVTEQTTNSAHFIQQYIDVPNSEWWKLSLNVTPIGARNVQIYVMDANNQSGSRVMVQCGLSGTGSVLSQSGSPDASTVTTTATALANGSYTCAVGGKLGSGGTGPTRLRLIVYPLDGTATVYQGDGTSGLRVHSATLSGALPAPSCTTKAYSTCSFVQSLFSMREGFGAGVTGGLGGDVVTVTNLNDSGPGSLRAAVMLEPKTKPVWVKFAPGLTGTIPLLSSIQVPANRTIDGRNAAITISGKGLNFFGNFGAGNNIVNNIAIRDIQGTEDDAISIANSAKGIWVHRTSLSGQGGDGLLDISNGATDITVSWSTFSDHNKVMIVNSYETGVVNGVEVLNGHELDFYDRDKDARVTLHHNTFIGTGQRHPRAVFGKVHLYNNLFSGWSSYGIGSSFRAQTLAEGNIFEHTGAKGIMALLTQIGIDPEPGFANLLNNLFSGTAVASSSMPGSVFSAPYQYRCMEANDALRAKLIAEAGPGTFDSSVNNTALSTGCPTLEVPPPPVSEWETVPVNAWNATKATWAGTTTAGAFTENSMLATHALGQYLPVTTGTSTWRFSFEVKPRGARDVRVYVFDSNNQSTAYLATQCVLSGTGSLRSFWSGQLATGLSSGIEALPDGWYKCTLSGVPNSGGVSSLRLVLQTEINGVTNYQGDGVSGLDLRSILLERK